VLYTKDPRTGDHLVIDGKRVSRFGTRAEALAVAAALHEAQCARRKELTGSAR
jgi:hypothetical protein